MTEKAKQLSEIGDQISDLNRRIGELMQRWNPINDRISAGTATAADMDANSKLQEKIAQLSKQRRKLSDKFA